MVRKINAVIVAFDCICAVIWSETAKKVSPADCGEMVACRKLLFPSRIKQSDDSTQNTGDSLEWQYVCPVCPLWTALLLSHQSPVVSRVSTVGQNCRLLSRPPDRRPHWAAPPLIGFYSRLDLLQCSASKANMASRIACCLRGLSKFLLLSEKQTLKLGLKKEQIQPDPGARVEQK